MSLALRQETEDVGPAPLSSAVAASPRVRFLVLACIAVLIVSMLVGLGWRPLSEPDEGRNAEVAREMAASGSILEPHLNGLPYVDKPFVHFLAVAESMKFLGQAEWTARLPSALATLLTALVTAAFARRLFGSAAVTTAALAYLASPLAWIFGQLVILDALFTLWVVLALLALYVAIEAAGEGRRRARLGWALGGWGCIALAVLTKGPVGLLLPLAVSIPLAIRRRALGVLFDPRGIVLAVALIAPWAWWMAHRVPDYVHYVAFVETWKRVATSALNRDRPFWYLPLLLVPATFPGSAVALAAAWKGARRRHWEIEPRTLLLASWIIVPLVLFSLFHSKMPQYVLPLTPGVALAAAGVTSQRREGAVPGVKAACCAWILVGTALACSPMMRAVQDLGEPFRAQAHLIAAVGAVVAIASGLYGLTSRIAGPRSVVVAVLPLIALYLAGQPIFTHILEHSSSRPLAASIRATLPAGGRVLGVKAYPQSLPFYLERTIEVASDDAVELSSNYLVATYANWVGPGSTLHPLGAWRSALRTCSVPTIFIARVSDAGVRGVLARAGLPRLASDAVYALYGPCRGPETVAAR